jgi:hypothetical protein
MSEADKVPAGPFSEVRITLPPLGDKACHVGKWSPEPPDERFSWAVALSETELQALGDALAILDRLVPAPQDRAMASAAHAAFRVKLDPGKLMRIKRTLKAVVDRS